MPPRYAYWTILVDEQPTAFRAAHLDELQPTFKRLKDKHPSARLVWFQNGKVWNSRLDAQEAMRVRGERGKARDERQGGFRSRKHCATSRSQGPRTPRPPHPGPREGKLEWKPKGAAPERPALDWRPRSDDRKAPAPPARRPKTWRPGGDHKDPRQKYKDAKKAKWTRFKQNVRLRWEKKQGPGRRSAPRERGRKKDEE